jgi:hypothetical protein
MPASAIIYLDSHFFLLQDSFDSSASISTRFTLMLFDRLKVPNVILHSNTAGLSQATNNGRKAQDTDYICKMPFIPRSADSFESVF